MSLLEDMPPRPALHAVAPPPPERLPSPQLAPPEQLRGLLLHYRAVRVRFDQAWELAYALIQWPSSRRDASEWKHAVDGSREGWRAAYEGWTPEPREVAVGTLDRFLVEALRDDEDYELDAVA